tara:strand:+ start:630 stop:1199 length:570 start_codon:yes stop_codon:yes gene_type:complete
MNVIVILGISKFLQGGSKTITNRSHSYARLITAYDLYQKMETNFIICSGGFGQAKMMKNFLVNLGVPAEQIVEEGQSRTTIENCVYSYEYLNQIGNNTGYYGANHHQDNINLHIVTNDYHIERSMYIFNFFTYRLKIKVHLLAHSGSILEYLPDYTEADVQEVQIARDNDILNLERTPERLRLLKQSSL